MPYIPNNNRNPYITYPDDEPEVAPETEQERLEREGRLAEQEEEREREREERYSKPAKPSKEKPEKPKPELRLPGKKEWLVGGKIALGCNLIVGENADDYVTSLIPQGLMIVGGEGEEDNRVRYPLGSEEWCEWFDQSPLARDFSAAYFPDLYRSPDWSPATAARRVRELVEECHVFDMPTVIFRVDRLNSTLRRIADHIISLPKAEDGRFAVQGGVRAWLLQQIAEGKSSRTAITAAAVNHGKFSLNTVQSELSRLVQGGMLEAQPETFYRLRGGV